MNISSFDPLPLSHEPPPPDHPANRFPKVGETRCYWTLLSSDLRFIYLDPVLTAHLCEQAPLLIGKSVFEFVHPDEQASAKHDLGNVLESRTLHGSVTRIAFRASHACGAFLATTGPAHDWPDAEKIALDTNYMAVDLVINWAAEGLVLCFLHAVVDLTPFDNDEHVKTGWSNWCSTPGVDHQEAQILYQRLFNTIPQTGTMSRVFQILANQADRPLLMSWPPEQATGPTARDFARLSEEVQIGNSNLQAGSDAKTSCTRRYKALQNMTSSDGIREVESIFVPHGSIIFACHKVNVYSRNTSGNPPPMPQSSYDPSYLSSNHHQYYDSPYALPPMQPNPSYGSFMAQASQEVPTQYGSQQGWTSSEPSSSQQTYQWPSASSSPPFAPSQQVRPPSGSYSPHQQQHQWPAQSSPYFEAADPLAQQYQRPLSPPFSISSSAGDNAGASPSVSPDVVPPPRAAQRRTSPSTARDSYGSGGRSSGNPPVGVTRCSSCKVTSSPEWRKGPSGKKDLCNACGLRYARSRAKKEGITAQRRRKEKVMVQAMTKHDMPSSHQPPSTPPIPVPYSEFRRSSYDGSSLLSTSPSGSDAAYSHPGPSSFDSLTPSPSPPAHADFIHYGTREARAYSLGSTPFYSSSPLAAPPVQPLRTASGTPPMLPRASVDTLLGTFPQASYEREREDPRQGKTTLLTQ